MQSTRAFVNYLYWLPAPLGHFGTSQDIAPAVACQASDEACFITGSDITVDGGFSIYSAYYR